MPVCPFCKTVFLVCVCSDAANLVSCALEPEPDGGTRNVNELLLLTTPLRTSSSLNRGAVEGSASTKRAASRKPRSANQRRMRAMTALRTRAVGALAPTPSALTSTKAGRAFVSGTIVRSSWHNFGATPRSKSSLSVPCSAMTMSSHTTCDDDETLDPCVGGDTALLLGVQCAHKHATRQS